ncbi:hypothetical protein [Streptomyces cinereospinus]|uniref:Uncharacterized protein n=1 Tax=Streptomyces cinereospinus TaxID=285561 RepID=A0ABV5N6T8_9ACTN
MHAYDVSRRQSLQPIPSARSGQDHSGGPSATPIYDALCVEYVKSFRALPGDRRGEENLGFVAFGYLSQGSMTHSGSYSAYSAGAQSARHGGGQQPTWQRVGTVGQQHTTGTYHVPALPPGPRRGS